MKPSPTHTTSSKKKPTMLERNKSWRAFINMVNISFNAPKSLTELRQAGLQKVTSVNIRYSQLGAAGMRLFTQADCPLLDFVRISHCEVDAKGAKSLAQGTWHNLTVLDLQSNKLRSEGVRYLAEQGQFPKLRQISLYENQIDDRGIKWLARADWPACRCLILVSNKISDAQILTLVTYPNFPTLTNLYTTGGPYRLHLSSQVQKMLPLKCYFDQFN